MKLGIVSTDWSGTLLGKNGIPAMGGSGWIRIGQYLPYLNFDITIGRLAFLTETERLAVSDWNDDLHSDFDVIFMQRYMNAGLAENIKAARARHSTIVVQDIDDWYWGLDQTNNAWAKTQPKLSPSNNIDFYKKIIQASDYVITSTPYLADRLSSFFSGSRIILHENHVDLSRYTPRVHTEAEKPLIGWFGSTAHRSRDLEILQGTLSQVEKEFGFVHVGDMVGGHSSHTPFSEGVGIKEESMTLKLPLLRPDDLYIKGFDYDIGIVPLSSKPFNDAKSWIKGLEYSAAGVPFVASPSSEYRRFKSEYGVGRLAKNPGKWISHFRELRDPEIRQAEASENLERIQSLDVKIGAKTLEEILNSL